MILSLLVTDTDPPLVGPEIIVVVRMSPSGSESLSCTSITTFTVSSGTVILSATALGGLFNEVTVTNKVSFTHSTGIGVPASQAV